MAVATTDAERAVARATVSDRPATDESSAGRALAALATPWALVVITASIAVGAFLRGFNLDGLDQRAGEVLTEERARAPFGTAVESIAMPRNQAPLYFLLLRIVPGGVLEFRLLNVALGILAIALVFIAVAIVLRSPAIALWSGALFAVSPLAVLLSRIARPYPLLLALGLLAVIAFFVLLRGHRTRALWAAFTLVSALAFLTHYSALALIVAQAVAIAFQRPLDRTFARAWAISQGVAAVPVVAWALYTLTAPQESGVGTDVPGPELFTLPRTIFNLALGTGVEWTWWVVPGAIAAAIGLVAGVAWAAWRRSSASEFLLAILATTLLPLIAVALLVTPKYSDRYIAIALPALLAVLAAGWLRTRLAPAATAGLALVLVTATAVIGTAVVGEDEPRTEWSPAAEVVALEAGPEDLVVFQRWTTREAFLDAVPDGAELRAETLVLDEVSGTEAQEQAADRIFAVYRNPVEDFHTGGYRGFEPFTPGLAQMSDWLIEREDRIDDEDAFEGVRVFQMPGGTGET